MGGDARAAEPESSLNRPDPDGFLLVQAEDMPVDPKCEPLQFRLNDPIFLFLQESSSDYCRWRSLQSCPRTNSPGFRDCARRVWIVEIKCEITCSEMRTVSFWFLDASF